jgi:hypothetical protein
VSLAIWVVGALFLWSSGALVAWAFRVQFADRVLLLGAELTLGLAIWPLLFLLTTTVGLAIRPDAMRLLVFATIVAALIRAGVRLRRTRWTRLRPALPFLGTVAVLTMLAMATRLLHIRGLTFPPWVDGVHHAMVVRLLLEQGMVPATAGPYIAGAQFFYHWGFHVPAAFIGAAVGATKGTDIPTLLLQYGQLLNVLSLFAAYAAGRVLLRSREGGLLAAVLAMFVSYYPAYYVSWGRSPHLAGTLLLPWLLIFLWRLAQSTSPWRWLPPSALLAAGLVLIHVRIALFAALTAVILVAATKRLALRTVLRWAAAAAVALVLIAPWLVTLARNPHVSDVTAPAASRGVSMQLLASTHNRELLALATGGISGIAGWLAMPVLGRVLSGAWWIAVVLVARRRTRRRSPAKPLMLIGAVAALVLVTLFWRPIGIDLTGFATLDSGIITMFLPLALAGTALVVWMVEQTVPSLRGARFFACVLLVAVCGAATMTAVVNPSTVFADAADLGGLRWIEMNTPRDARFAVDSRAWIPPARVGVDGGYWLGVTTGRHSMLPPLLYAWSLPQPRVRAINAALENWSGPAPDWKAMREQGITHIYIGSHGSEMKRAMLLSTNRVKLLYRDGGVLVFAIR